MAASFPGPCAPPVSHPQVGVAASAAAPLPAPPAAAAMAALVPAAAAASAAAPISAPAANPHLIPDVMRLVGGSMAPGSTMAPRDIAKVAALCSGLGEDLWTGWYEARSGRQVPAGKRGAHLRESM